MPGDGKFSVEVEGGRGACIKLDQQSINLGGSLDNPWLVVVRDFQRERFENAWDFLSRNQQGKG